MASVHLVNCVEEGCGGVATVLHRLQGDRKRSRLEFWVATCSECGRRWTVGGEGT